MRGKELRSYIMISDHYECAVLITKNMVEKNTMVHVIIQYNFLTQELLWNINCATENTLIFVLWLPSMWNVTFIENYLFSEYCKKLRNLSQWRNLFIELVFISDTTNSDFAQYRISLTEIAHILHAVGIELQTL